MRKNWNKCKKTLILWKLPKNVLYLFHKARGYFEVYFLTLFLKETFFKMCFGSKREKNWTKKKFNRHKSERGLKVFSHLNRLSKWTVRNLTVNLLKGLRQFFSGTSSMSLNQRGKDKKLYTFILSSHYFKIGSLSSIQIHIRFQPQIQKNKVNRKT